MRKAARRWPVRTTGILFVVTLLALLTVNLGVAYDPTGQPPGFTEEAESMHNLYLIVTGMALVVFVVVESALVFMLIRFRKKSDELPPQIHGNNVLEVIWTAIPVVIVIALFVASFVVLVDIENDAEEQDLTVEVEGFQFSWIFTYRMNDLGTAGSDEASTEAIEIIGKAGEEGEPVLVIPIGEPVEFKLSSNDVIHSFYIRDSLYKLDVIPGRDNRFVITANTIGVYEGQCAELCGLNHALMRFSVDVRSRADFDTWVAEQRSESQTAAQQPK